MGITETAVRKLRDKAVGKLPDLAQQVAKQNPQMKRLPLDERGQPNVVQTARGEAQPRSHRKTKPPNPLS